MERSGFFDATLKNGEYDKVYLSQDFSEYFSAFIGNGYHMGIGEELFVSQSDPASMRVVVKSGRGYINGRYYANDEDLEMAIDIADGILNRIDIVVLQYSALNKEIRAKVKKGVPASVPVKPNIVRNADYYELQLCEIMINAGAANIQQINITDTRLNTALCGIVSGVADQLDSTTLGLQLQNFINAYIVEANRAYDEEFLGEIQKLIEQLEDLIDPEIAVQLSNRISILEEKSNLYVPPAIYVQTEEPIGALENSIWIQI